MSLRGGVFPLYSLSSSSSSSSSSPSTSFASRFADSTSTLASILTSPSPNPSGSLSFTDQQLLSMSTSPLTSCSSLSSPRSSSISPPLHTLSSLDDMVFVNHEKRPSVDSSSTDISSLSASASSSMHSSSSSSSSFLQPYYTKRLLSADPTLQPNNHETPITTPPLHHRLPASSSSSSSSSTLTPTPTPTTPTTTTTTKTQQEYSVEDPYMLVDTSSEDLSNKTGTPETKETKEQEKSPIYVVHNTHGSLCDVKHRECLTNIIEGSISIRSLLSKSCATPPELLLPPSSLSPEINYVMFEPTHFTDVLIEWRKTVFGLNSGILGLHSPLFLALLNKWIHNGWTRLAQTALHFDLEHYDVSELHPFRRFLVTPSLWVSSPLTSPAHSISSSATFSFTSSSSSSSSSSYSSFASSSSSSYSSKKIRTPLSVFENALDCPIKINATLLQKCFTLLHFRGSKVVLKKYLATLHLDECIAIANIAAQLKFKTVGEMCDEHLLELFKSACMLTQPLKSAFGFTAAAAAATTTTMPFGEIVGRRGSGFRYNRSYSEDEGLIIHTNNKYNDQQVARMYVTAVSCRLPHLTHHCRTHLAERFVATKSTDCLIYNHEKKRTVTQDITRLESKRFLECVAQLEERREVAIIQHSTNL